MADVLIPNDHSVIGEFNSTYIPANMMYVCVDFGTIQRPRTQMLLLSDETNGLRLVKMNETDCIIACC